ncbi:MAG: cyanophycinase [Spirochaetes bacterium]|nr:cyanophycinase [Spirochaetota bacterium]
MRSLKQEGILPFNLMVLALAAGLFVTPTFAQEIGPSKGALVIIGGNMKDPVIIKRFLELAGGLDAPIVVIPTAASEPTYGEYWSGLRMFKDAGATNLTVLHTTSREEADSEEFVRPIQKARGVFLSGGRQWRLADSYLNTRAHKELSALLERGGVIGGSSAGATIQGSFLVRGDTKGNETMMGDHLEGLGFLRNVAIDQHLLARNRHFDLIEVVERHPHLLGIGLDEDTAIVVRGDAFEVIGRSYVAIYDNQFRMKRLGRFYFLSAGDRYDMKKREASRPAQVFQPITGLAAPEIKK